MDRPGALNIMSLIAADPLYYRNFGVWWFAVKAQLREAGHDLGTYTDPAAEAYYDGLSPSELLDEAIEHQIEARQIRASSAFHMTPDGEPFQIWDEDMETGAWLS
jgi:hypothetical protein